MRVLVSGGAGFIGSNLCRRLVHDAAVDEVVVIDDFSTGHEANLDDIEVSLHRASILDERAVAVAVAGCDTIVHLAALGSVPRSVADPIATHEVNVRGTLNVLQAARAAGGRHVVLASSSSVYGANPTLPKVETAACQPMSPYAVSKLAAEQYPMAFAQCYSLPALPFRFFNVYGPGQRPGQAYAAVVPVFVDAALAERPLPLHGDGRQSRDFTFVDTVTEVLTRAVLEGVTAEPTNLAFGTRTDLRSVIEMLADVLGRGVEVQNLPARSGDVRHSQADNSRLQNLFPDIEPAPLHHGLKATLDWMRSLANEKVDARASDRSCSSGGGSPGLVGPSRG